MIRELFEQKPELKKIILFGLLGIVALIIVIIVFSSFKGEKLTYEQLENKMKYAAISYYETNKDKLPSDGNSVTLQYNTLVEAEEIKAIDKYTTSSCTGRVIIKNTNNNYSYTPYLDCGSDYKTIEFYNKILSDNEIVTNDSGLYVNGSSKVFRGENVNNFVKIGDKMWRIVRIDDDNSVKLILYSDSIRTTFDNRYNAEKGYSIGKNIYSFSRLKETIDEVYNEDAFLNSDIKGKLVSKPLCVGARNSDDSANDGSTECSETLEGQYIGALSLYEYIYASLDSKCNSAKTKECQNYNYLAKTEYNISWWLITPAKENTYQSYYVSSYGSIDVGNCSINLNARPTIYLSTDIMYSSGTGTLEDPYIIR